MTDVRYGYQEGEIDGLELESEIVYANTEETAMSQGEPESVFDANPSQFFVREIVKRPVKANEFFPRSVSLVAGLNPTQVSGLNPRRSKARLWVTQTDPATAGPFVYVSNSPTGYPSAKIGPETGVLEIEATGIIYATTDSDSGAEINLIEESYT